VGVLAFAATAARVARGGGGVAGRGGEDSGGDHGAGGANPPVMLICRGRGEERPCRERREIDDISLL